jgi:hypothetical protein
VEAEGAPDTGSTTTTTAAPTEPTLPAAYVDLGIDLDVDLVFRGLCMAWRFDLGRDDGAINDAISDFLANQPDRSSLYTPEQLSDAVRRGCAEDTATEGLSTTLDTLSLTSPAIAQMIDDACLRYARTVAGEPGGQEFDIHISSLLGLGHDELAALVVDVCGADTFETYEEQLAQRKREAPPVDPDAPPEQPAYSTSTTSPPQVTAPET